MADSQVTLKRREDNARFAEQDTTPYCDTCGEDLDDCTCAPLDPDEEDEEYLTTREENEKYGY